MMFGLPMYIEIPIYLLTAVTACGYGGMMNARLKPPPSEDALLTASPATQGLPANQTWRLYI